MSAANDAPTPPATTPLLEVAGLSVRYPLRAGLLGGRRYFTAVDDVAFHVNPGETLGLVGESGSGKTTIGRALVRLAPIAPGGSVRFDGTELATLGDRAFRPWRKRMQMIFQDPYHSLNPRLLISEILAEPLRIHFPAMKATERRDRCAALLQDVGLAPVHLDRHPHEFSGGQRQRIGIARALAVEPELIICDECVSALDVSVQAQIVNLLQDLQERHGLAYIFIAHDLAIVEHISDRIAVLDRGRIVEQGPAVDLCANPNHECTRRLIEAIPAI